MNGYAISGLRLAEGVNSLLQVHLHEFVCARNSIVEALIRLLLQRWECRFTLLGSFELASKMDPADLLGADGVEEFVGAEEQGVAGNGGSGVELGIVGVDEVAGEFFKLRFGGKDKGAGLAGDAVEAITDEDWRGIEGFAAAAGAVLDGAFAIDILARFGVETGGKTLVVDDIEMALVKHWGGDIRTGVGLPEFVGLGEVTRAADFESGTASGGVAAEDEEFVAAIDDGWGDIAGQAMGSKPAEFAGVGVHAPKFLWHGEHEVDLVVPFHESWSAVGRVEVVTFGFPEDGAGLGIECYECAAFVAGIDDEFAIVKDGTSGGTPAFGGRGFAEVGLPAFFAVHIKGEGAGLAEEDIDVFAIGDWGMGGVAVLGDEALIRVFRLFGRYVGLPNQLAVLE